MAERGNTTHGRRLDEEMKLETDGLTRNAVPDRTQEWRQPEPMPDDTDSQEVLDAMEPNGVFGFPPVLSDIIPDPSLIPDPLPEPGTIPVPGTAASPGTIPAAAPTPFPTPATAGFLNRRKDA